MRMLLAAGLVLFLGVMGWQHARYLSARRAIVEDEQPLLYSASALHVATFLELGDGAAMIERVSTLCREIEAAGGLVVYVGQVAFTRSSDQIGPRDWDAVVLVQYPSRDEYEAAVGSAGVKDALASFDRVYSHGMKRPRLVNLLLPQALLALRFVDVIRGSWHVEELAPAPPPEPAEQRAFFDEAIASLERLRAVNDEALVVFNLIQSGDAMQQAANRSYGLKMVRRMAAGAHGPMHVGAAVTLEGDARFENVVIVYYPGPGYFANLLRSSFFQEIIGDKQLRDTQAVPTVPIRSRLTS